MEDRLHERIVDQQEAIDAVSEAVRRGRAGLKDPRRPIGSFIFLGPTGVGKSYLACALAHRACREGYSALYWRAALLFEELSTAKGDGRYRKLMARYARVDLLVLDDWGLSPLTDEQRHDMLELLEDRHESRSTLVTSQFPVEKWHPIIGNPSLADAILDRLVHNAYRLTLKGDSLRKKHKKNIQQS